MSRLGDASLLWHKIRRLANITASQAEALRVGFRISFHAPGSGRRCAAALCRDLRAECKLSNPAKVSELQSGSDPRTTNQLLGGLPALQMHRGRCAAVQAGSRAAITSRACVSVPPPVGGAWAPAAVKLLLRRAGAPPALPLGAHREADTSMLAARWAGLLCICCWHAPPCPQGIAHVCVPGLTAHDERQADAEEQVRGTLNQSTRQRLGLPPAAASRITICSACAALL